MNFEQLQTKQKSRLHGFKASWRSVVMKVFRHAELYSFFLQKYYRSECAFVDKLRHRAPGYLVDCCIPVSDVASRQHLLDSTMAPTFVAVPTKYIWLSGVFCPGLTAWNLLLDSLPDPSCSGNTFRRDLKTALFSTYLCTLCSKDAVNLYIAQLHTMRLHYINSLLILTWGDCIRGYMESFDLLREDAHDRNQWRLNSCWKPPNAGLAAKWPW